MTARHCFLIISISISALCWGQNSSPGKLEVSKSSVDAQLAASAISAVCQAEAILKATVDSLGGCRVCPVGSDFQGERNMEWRVQQVTAGHFTSPEAENILLNTSGCESHSHNFGGSFLFVVESGRPRFLAYRSAVITESCHKLRYPDGREFLVCQRHWGGQGEVWTYVETVAFEPSGKVDVTPLFMTEDTVKTCSAAEEVRRALQVQSSTIQSTSFPDLNGDGLADLSLRVTLGRKLLSGLEAKKCEQSLIASNFKASGISIPTKEYKIDFLFDGKRFLPTTASKKLMHFFPKPTFPN